MRKKEPKTLNILKIGLILLTGSLTSLQAASTKKELAPPKKRVSTPKNAPLEENLFDKNHESFIGEGEMLYWGLQPGDMSYVFEGQRQRGRVYTGSYTSVNFKYRPGMRFKLGYYRAHNFWQATADYTFIRFIGNSNAKKSPHNNVKVLTPVFQTGLSIFEILDASTLATISYKTANVLACRVFVPQNNPHLRLRVHGGPAFTWIRQDWSIDYMNRASEHSRIEKKNHYWGAGLRAGLTFDWFWGYDIYLTGAFSPALVCGHLTRSDALKATPDATYIKTNYDDYRLSFNANFSLGPSYQKTTLRGRFEVFVGYELQMWTNISDIENSQFFLPIPEDGISSLERSVQSNLFSVQGLTSRLTIYF